jgi:drug/metabolite transporter (DMT)-like permease
LLFLFGSIVFSSYLTLSFKVLQRYDIHLMQAIVFNYWTCVITGSFVNGRFPIDAGIVKENWFQWACIMGGMFFIIFNIVGFTAQKIGVAVASVANKLSLIIPFIFSVYLYNEKATVLKIAGIIIALAAVILTCYPQKRENETGAVTSKALLVIFPVILFFSSGLLDTLIKYVEQQFLNDDNKNDYLITAFAAAGTIGTVVAGVLLFTDKMKFDKKSILAGIIIGIPNYFSIWCLVRVLKDYAASSSQIIPINNMGIVLFSAVAAMLLFKEKLSAINWAGIILSLGAIALIAYG